MVEFLLCYVHCMCTSALLNENQAEHVVGVLRKFILFLPIFVMAVLFFNQM